MITVSKDKFERCCACGTDALDLLSELPKFPHVGIFIKDPKEAEDHPLIDNSVYVCTNCGHVQLGYAVDPGFLYTTEFQHKTSHSASAKQANDFLYAFAKKICAKMDLKLVVEIGCNDTFLLQKFAEEGIDVAGVDPIFKGREADFVRELSDKLKARFKVVGDFIENIDFESKFGKSPDLYLTNFVFEHLKDPYEVARSMVERAKPDSVIIIGVPGAEFLLLNNRFDQLSHQHYQQYTIPSFSHLIQRAGGEIIDISVNFANWGQILIAFKKGTPKTSTKVDMALTPAQIKESFKTFHRQLDDLKARLHLLRDKPIYGVGAAQNFPIFAYFYKDQLPFSEIVDDSPLRQNKTFPHVPVNIVPAKGPYTGAVGFLSASDYGRVLIARMSQLDFDHIVLPFNSI